MSAIPGLRLRLHFPDRKRTLSVGTLLCGAPRRIYSRARINYRIILPIKWEKFWRRISAAWAITMRAIRKGSPSGKKLATLSNWSVKQTRVCTTLACYRRRHRWEVYRHNYQLQLIVTYNSFTCVWFPASASRTFISVVRKGIVERARATL